MLSDLQKKAIEAACGGASHADDTSISDAVAGVVAAQAVTPIADPASATAEDCANAINAILSALNNG